MWMAVGSPPNSSEGGSMREAGGEGDLPDSPLLLEVTVLGGIALPYSGIQHAFPSTHDIIGVLLVCSCSFDFYSLLFFCQD